MADVKKVAEENNVKKIENIKYLKQIGQFDKMPEQLQNKDLAPGYSCY